MSSNHRRKKPPVKVRIARSPTPVDQTSIVRAIRVRRTAAGRIGASITHTETRVEEPAGGPTPAPYAAGSQTNTLEGAAGLDIELDTSNLVQEPEQLDAQADKPQASPVSSTSTVFSVALTSRHFQYRPIQDWIPHRQVYLEELLRHDGRKDDISHRCSTIGCTDAGRFVCRDCMHSNSHCQTCLVGRHHNLPFHRITVTSSGYLQPVSFG